MASDPGGKERSRNISLDDATRREKPASTWRRTTRGWERNSAWLSQESKQPTGFVSQTAAHIHPTVIAALQLLASIAALVAFDRSEDRIATSSAL